MSSNDLKKNVEMLSEAQSSLYLFTKNIFAKSFTNFVDGKYIEDTCNYLQKYDRTMRIAARSHFKSTSFYSKISRDVMFEGIKRDLDIKYFSYSYDLAAWHVNQIKTIISKNPYFREIIDLKSTAENVAKFTWDRKHIISIRPTGILTFSRGSKATHIYCMPAKTKIETLNGSKLIKEIKVGDLVKTHLGRYRKVLNVYKRKNYSKIYKIQTKYQTLYLTKNHPILATTINKNTGYCNRKSWRKSQRLKIGHMLHYPKKYIERKVYFSVIKKRKDRKIYNPIPLSSNFAWLLGLYVAEGSGKNRITFSLGSHEKKLIKKTSKILKDFFGKVYLDNSHSWETNVIVNSRCLGETFRKWTGEHAKNKHIPSFIFKSDEQKKASFLKGLIEGDGCIKKNGVTFVSASKQLRDDFVKLCQSISISCTSISFQTTQKGFSSRKRTTIFRCHIHPLDWNKIQTLSENEFIVKNIKRVWPKNEYPEFKWVYNLKVEEDNTYIANGFVVHNCDDILSDPVNLIHPTIILKVSDIFKSVLLESLKPEGEIHIIGSPLSNADIYFDPDIQKRFHFKSTPAIIKDNNGNEIPAWPEFYTLEKIKDKIKTMGEKIFAAEMMMTPYYSTDTFFKKEQLRKDVVNPQLKNIRLYEGINTSDLVVAGLDIGKKKHPADLTIFRIKNNKAIQVHRKQMRKWPYYTGKPFNQMKPSQVEYCKEAIKNFGISYLYYDNTRGEFEGAKDSGLLTTHFVPVVFTPKMRIQMATEFEKAVLNKQIEIFDDEEMLNSICSVTNDLMTMETAGGSNHGDCFWSTALALIGLSKFGNFDVKGRIPSSGSPGVFEKETPKGW
jgi:intein/homing endonuclease